MMLPRPRSRLLLVLALPAALVLLAGCLRHKGGRIEDLFISKERWVIDKTTDIVHIYGLIENKGKTTIREAEIVATLRSGGPSGESRGENSLILQNIQPLEKRPFALAVTSHDQVRDVELTIRKPRAP